MIILSWEYFIARDVTYEYKKFHMLTLRILEGPFKTSKDAKNVLSEMNENSAFIIEGQKIKKDGQ